MNIVRKIKNPLNILFQLFTYTNSYMHEFMNIIQTFFACVCVFLVYKLDFLNEISDFNKDVRIHLKCFDTKIKF